MINCRCLCFGIVVLHSDLIVPLHKTELCAYWSYLWNDFDFWTWLWNLAFHWNADTSC